ncbi:MAG: VCBS repeat-containing protein [Candidatus Omnitrophica bacterium]|nr:VCBS repeat-containing protein [Candidatus Omnitrophota bacterium]
MKTKTLILLLAIGLVLFFTNGVFADEVVSKEQVSKSAKETVSKNAPSQDTQDVSKDTSSTSEQIDKEIDNQQYQDPEAPETLLRTTLGSEPFSSSEKFQVEPSTGTATLSIPIEVAQGRKGIQPSIALMYNSSSPNGILGVGWSLELGSIQRSTKRGVPTYDDSQDTFVLVQNGSTQELVSTTGNEYRAKIEGAFMRFEYLGSSGWIVTDKKGIKYYFGQTQDSQQYDPNNTSHIFKWCLDRVEDLHGNYMTLSYQKIENQIYPQYIDYTGNSTYSNPTFADIEFVLEDGTDTNLSYRAGFAITTAKRISGITAKVDGNLQRRYQLDYEDSPSTQRSLLTSITQYGADGTTSLPQTTFSYTQFPTTYPWENADWTFPNNSEFNIANRIVDINNDVLPDMLKYSSGGVNYNHTFLNNDSGWDLTDNEWRPLPNNHSFYYWPPSGPHDNGIRFADVDNDGWQDVVASKVHRGIPWGSGWDYRETYVNDQISFWTLNETWRLPDDAYIGMLCGDGYSDWGDTGGVLLQDVNGDGLIDVAIARTHNPDSMCSCDYNHNVWLNNGSGWDLADYATPEEANFKGGGQHTPLVDINADGLADIIFAKNNHTNKTFLNTGSGWQDQGTYILPDDIDLTNGKSILSDINSDGFPDILKIDGSTRICYLNFNGNFTQSNTYAIAEGQFENSTTRLFDVNADGLIDVVRNENQSQQYVQLNSGPIPDLLQTIDNGIGATTQITYTPSTQYDNTGDDDKCDLPFPIQTVSQTTVIDQVSGQSYTTNYEYADGLWDWQTREFRGFGYVKVIDVDQNYTETEFLQGGYNKGRIKEQRSFDAAGNPYTKVVNDWQQQDLGNGSEFVYLNKTDNYIYNGDSSGKRTQTQNSYDSYGNITQTIALGEVDESSGADLDSTDNRISQVEYTYNTTDWLLGLPKTTYVQDYNGDTLKQSWFYYDGNPSPDDIPTQGLLTKQEDWLLGSNQNPVTSYQYDDYGNLLSTTDALDHITTITYDTGYQIFPLVTANHLEHQVVNEYYGINGVPLDDGTYRGLWGQTKSSTDPNGNTGYSIYDTFGRIEKQISPLDSVEYPTSSIEYHLETLPIKIISHQRQISGSPDTLDTLSFYDGLGRLIQTKSESEQANKFVVSGQTEYNSRGLPYKKYLPFFDTNYSFLDCVPISQNPYLPAVIDYDSQGRVTQSTNPDGTYSNIIYDDWITTTIDENGHKQKSYFDAFGRLIQKEEYQGADGRDPDNYPATAYTLYATTTYIYDLLGNLIQTQDQANNIVTISYDTLSRKTSMSDPDMGDWSYEYNKVGNLIKQTDAKGQEITFEYDEINRLIEKSSLVSGNWLPVTYSYDDPDIPHSKGRLTQASYSQAQGDTRFYYDELGREIKSEKTIDNITYTVERSYDSAGRLTSVTYPDSEVVNYSYNTAGQIEKIMNATNSDLSTKLLLHCDGGDGSTNFPDSSVFNHPVTAVGGAQIDAAEYKFGSASGLFDGDGDYLSIPDSNDWDYGSGDFTIDFWVRFNDTASENYFYDQYTSPTDSIRFSLSPTNNIIFRAKTGGVNDAYYVYNWSYSSGVWSHLALVRNGTSLLLFIDGTLVTWTFIYDAIGNNILPDISADLEIGKYLNGWLDEFRISKGIARWTSNFTPPADPYSSDAQYFVSNVDYNASGQITKIEYGNGTVTEYEYDENTLRLAHLVTEHQGSSIQDLSYTYDSVGNILQITDGINTASQDFTYDELNRLITADNSVYSNKTYEYDEIGNMTLKDSVNYYYGEGDAGPHAITSGSDGSEFLYDDNGNMTSWLTADNDTFNYEFDPENRLTQVKKNNSLVAKFEYDGDGGRTKKIEYISFASSERYSLKPDKQQKRYVFEFLSSFLENANNHELIAYPDIGQSGTGEFGYLDIRDKFVSDNLVSQSPSLGSPDNPISSEYTDNISDHRASVLSAPILIKDFFAVREAEAATVHSQSIHQPFTQTTIYIGSLYEKTSGVSTKHIFLGSQRIASIKNQASSIYYYHTNHLGSTDTITNSFGEEVVHYEYAPYGEIILTDGPDTTDYKFTGKPFDSETGLYYYGARYYNPTIGRFITPDTLVQNPFDPQALNRYTYCRNNPVNLTDPTGHWSWSKFWKSFAGAFVGAIVTVLTAGAGAPLWIAGMAGGFFGGGLTGGLEGGWKGMLIGAAAGGALGAFGGWGVGEFGWGFGAGMLVAGAGVAGATNSWDRFAGGLVGGLSGWAVGSGIDAHFHQPLSEAVPEGGVRNQQIVEGRGVGTTPKDALQVANETGSRVVYTESRGFVSDMVRGGMQLLFKNSLASRQFAQYMLGHPNTTYNLHSEMTLTALGAAKQLAAAGQQVEGSHFNLVSAFYSKGTAESAFNGIGATVNWTPPHLADSAGMFSIPNPVTAPVYGTLGVVTLEHFHGYKTYQPK